MLAGVLLGVWGSGAAAAQGAGEAQPVTVAAARVPGVGMWGVNDAGEQARPVQKGFGDVSGTVTDTDGDAIPKAQVTLTDSGGTFTLKTDTDIDGYFSFLNVPAGELKMSIASEGFETSVQPVSLDADEVDDLPDIALAVASENVDVEVRLTQSDRAEVDVKQAEKQRLIGFVPNFYVTYNWHAPPLTAKQKFELAFHSIYDPASILINAGVAGVMQATNSFSGYGQGTEGYFKRFGANSADFTAGTLLGGAIFPVIFRQDPRYFYKGTGSITSRALYALSTAVICRNDSGEWRPNYSGVLGDVAAGAVSNTYYPSSDRSGWILTVEAGLLNAAEDGVGNLIQEFVYKHFTPSAKNP